MASFYTLKFQIADCIPKKKARINNYTIQNNLNLTPYEWWQFLQISVVVKWIYIFFKDPGWKSFFYLIYYLHTCASYVSYVMFYTIQFFYHSVC